MARYGRTLLFTAPQESISPTAAGMNITGIIWSRKLFYGGDWQELQLQTQK